jgi:hypothetical protein
MHCKHCGDSITTQQKVCPNCGYPTAEGSPAAAVNSSPPTEGPRGVGGWLLVLCILLTIVFPLNTLYATVMSLRYHPDPIIVVLNAANVGLALLSLVAGARLWSARKLGVKLAKIFLVLGPLHPGAILCLVIYNAHVLQASVTVLLAMRILALPLLLSVIWYRYLVESRRVKNTYGTN